MPNVQNVAPGRNKPFHDPVLDVSGIGKVFGNRLVFRRVTFAMAPGESIAITGANGSGKSTLVRIVAGVLSPSAGEVTLREDGRAVRPEQRPMRAGLVAPYLNVYDGLSARENLSFLMRARGQRADEGWIEDVLRRVGLDARADDPVSAYSSGMKQRARIAAALLFAPPLLLLDEPTSNLDRAGILMVAEVMAEHTARGGLLVVATNDPREAAHCARSLDVTAFGRQESRSGALA